MANVSVTTMTTGVPGMQVTIVFNNANDRIGDVEWSVPAGIVVNILIWVDGLLAIDRTESAGSGSEKVPGNYQVEQVEVYDDELDITYIYTQLPANIEYVFSSQVVP